MNIKLSEAQINNMLTEIESLQPKLDRATTIAVARMFGIAEKYFINDPNPTYQALRLMIAEVDRQSTPETGLWPDKSELPK